MHVVTFMWSPAGHGDAGELQVDVDGVSLREMIRVHELPLATAEGHPSIAGGYAGLAGWACPPDVRAHFLGTEDSHLHCGPHDKTVLLGCDCGEVGCWPLMARVTAGADLVRWSAFEQPHRRESWDYGDLSLTFARDDYEVARRRASAQRGGTLGER